MTKENVGNLNFEEILSQNVRFEIPFFQRGYAWEKKQWDQMFNDIQEQILDETDDPKAISTNEHFFGPMVVLEQSNSDPTIRKFLVIDGQQRITTVYLLLGIIKRILSTKIQDSQDANNHINYLDSILINNVSSGDDYKKIKVFSSKGDRLPTFKCIFESNPNSPILNADMQLYNPESNNVDLFKHYAEKKLRKEFKSVPELWNLATACLKSLKIVWIPLREGKDDPQAIFESLNDRGMPLTAAELLCNYIFKPLIAANENYEDLHNNKWLHSQRSVEGDKGFENYLRILFSIGEKKIIGKDRKVYTYYKNKYSELNVQNAKNSIEHISSNVNLYNYIVNPAKNRHPNKSINEILIKINNTRMEACYTFILSVLISIKETNLTEAQGLELLKETLVLLVRRKYGELSTTKYDTLFPNLLKKIISEPDQITAMHDIIKRENYWISDQEFEDYFLHRPLYRERDLPFTRMILQDVDKSLSNYGQLPDYTTLMTVEHVLPQTIDNHWKIYLGADYSDPELNRYIDTIGNLCLLSGPANSHAGQDPFEDKIIDFPDVSALSKDLKNRNVKWNIKAIKDRSVELGEHIKKTYSWKI
jgi:uncharacterized protein with ParB-like and HNH nuclease domain